MKKLSTLLAIAICMFMSAGCSKQIITHEQPEQYAVKNARVFDAPYDKVWKATVDAIASSFWTLDNIEKDSGILTLSYACNDATPWVDCGKTHNVVTMGIQDIVFDSATPYVALKAANDMGNVWDVERRVSMFAKSNVLVKKITANQTKVTINTNYTLKCDIGMGTFRAWTGQILIFSQPSTSTVTFTTTQEGRGQNNICRSKHTLEDAILQSIYSNLN